MAEEIGDSALDLNDQELDSLGATSDEEEDHDSETHTPQSGDFSDMPTSPVSDTESEEGSLYHSNSDEGDYTEEEYDYSQEEEGYVQEERSDFDEDEKDDEEEEGEGEEQDEQISVDDETDTDSERNSSVDGSSAKMNSTAGA